MSNFTPRTRLTSGDTSGQVFSDSGSVSQATATGTGQGTSISDTALIPAFLLSLPPEILIQIICSLPPADVFSFQLTTKHLDGIIRGSVDIQYHIALSSSCNEDNPYSSLPIAEKLLALKNREEAWSLVEPRFTSSIKLPNHAWRYQLLAGVLFLADFESNTVHFLRLPSEEDEETRWEKITTSKSVIEFCPVVEYDLIIIVTTTPQTVDDRAVHRIEVELCQLSTGKSHPQTKESRIFVMNSPQEKPIVYVRIVGENLVPIFSFSDNEADDDQIFVFQWKSGELKANWRAEHGSLATCLFLSEDILLIPNKHTKSLDIFQILARPNLVTPAPLLVLSLPKLHDDHEIRYIFPRTKPDPCTSPSQWVFRKDDRSKRFLSARSFVAEEEETISIFQVVIDDVWGLKRDIFSFIMQTRTLKELVEKHYADGQRDLEGSAPIIPYSLWGPSATRWFGPNEYANTWVASAWGQRYVQMKYDTYDQGVPLIVMDFNPERVKAWQRVNGKRKEEAIIEEGVEDGPRTWCVSSLDRVEDAGIFKEPVHGGLPYIASTTEGLYTFEGLMMDDERILGVKESLTGDMESIEVLHFG